MKAGKFTERERIIIDIFRSIINDSNFLMPGLDCIEFYEMRKRAKLTMSQVSKGTKISITLLSHLENGKAKNPSYKTVRDLIMYYKANN